MASSKWKTWDELAETLRDKRVVFWGASNWIERMLEKLPVAPERGAIVDNNPNNHGIRYCGFDVHPPSWLEGQPRDAIYVVICTVNYASVIDELHARGFVMGEEFCCNPLLNERKAKDDLKSLARKVLVSSPEHASTATRGGGIYEVDTASGDVRKLYAGKCRGISYMGDDLLAIDMLRGLVVLDPEFRVARTIPLPPNSEPHGAHYDPSSRLVFVGQPGRDSIGVYDMASGVPVDEFFLSGKWARNKKDNHHVNDCWVGADDTLYVSMFSFSGNWLHEAYDGGILTEGAAGPGLHQRRPPHLPHRHGRRMLNQPPVIRFQRHQRAARSQHAPDLRQSLRQRQPQPNQLRKNKVKRARRKRQPPPIPGHPRRARYRGGGAQGHLPAVQGDNQAITAPRQFRRDHAIARAQVQYAPPVSHAQPSQQPRPRRRQPIRLPRQ